MPIKRFGIHNDTQKRFVVEEGATIWRYTDLGKYLDFLTTGTLWFTRAKELQKIDPYESNVTKYDFERLTRIAAATDKQQLKSIFDDFGIIHDYLFSPEGPALEVIQAMYLSAMKQTLFYSHCYAISCWHRNEIESDGMWALYAHREAGIAIKSNVRRVLDAFSSSSRMMDIAAVTYDPSDRISALTNDIFAPLLVKRFAFHHEREVRIIADCFDGFDKGEKPNEYLLDFRKDLPTGVRIECDLQTLIDEVVLSPLMPPHFADAVMRVTGKFAPSTLVRKSELLAPPVWQINVSTETQNWLEKWSFAGADDAHIVRIVGGT